MVELISVGAPAAVAAMVAIWAGVVVRRAVRNAADDAGAAHE